jgi:hypothetical protein
MRSVHRKSHGKGRLDELVLSVLTATWLGWRMSRIAVRAIVRP